MDGRMGSRVWMVDALRNRSVIDTRACLGRGRRERRGKGNRMTWTCCSLVGWMEYNTTSTLPYSIVNKIITTNKRKKKKEKTNKKKQEKTNKKKQTSIRIKHTFTKTFFLYTIRYDNHHSSTIPITPLHNHHTSTLYHMPPHPTTLHHILPHPTIPHHTSPHSTTLHHIPPHPTTLNHHPPTTLLL